MYVISIQSYSMEKKITKFCPGWCGSVGWLSPFTSLLGYMPRLWAWCPGSRLDPQGACRRQPINISLSLPLFSSLSKINRKRHLTESCSDVECQPKCMLSGWHLHGCRARTRSFCAMCCSHPMHGLAIFDLECGGVIS